MQTYLFYDIETTGLNKAFDQVLHFAAIRTDLNLKELDRHEIKVKLNRDIIPSPYALITHRMGINEITSGISEFEAIQQIHQWLNEKGTISLGYNTLGFDDEFLRFSFYRNLLPPYTHQYANQCSRMDIYPMAIMFYLFKNSVLSWPTVEGMPSLKLENINAENQFISGRSHHAMIDVEVTLELAKRFLRERDMWEYLHGCFNKQKDIERMQALQNTSALMIDGIFGAKNAYQCSTVFLGNHKHYKNQSLWLRLDWKDFAELSHDTLIENTYVINKKPGEPAFALPKKDRFLQHLNPSRVALAEKNSQWLKQHPDLFDEIIEHYVEYTHPVLQNTDPDAALYINGFWAFEEEAFCRKFHLAKTSEKALLTEKMLNPRLQTLALRILGRHYPESLTSALSAKFDEHLQKFHQEDTVDFKGQKKLTPQAALQEIAEIHKTISLDDMQIKLLNEFEQWLHVTAN